MKKNEDSMTFINLNSFNSNEVLNNNETQISFNNIKKNKPFELKNIILFFISEFGFFIIFFSSIYLFKFIPKYHSSKIFFSKNITKFEQNEDPIIFFHLTDMHLSKTRPNKTENAIIFLNSFLKYEADFLLLTGDLVDNFRGYYHWHRVGIQNNDDWDIFNKTIKKMISKYPIIDVAGNHDVWAADNIFSKENKFLENSFLFNKTSVKTEEDFIIKKIKFFNLTFILFNDYRFPTPRPPYGNEPYKTKKQLDLLENMIDELDSEECFILTHYNVDRMWYIKSSKGHTFEEIISKKNVYAIFTGHEHPNKTEIIHHGNEGGLEFCTPSLYDKKRSGLITFDNGNLFYHDVFIPLPGTEPKFFVTYPVNNDQISSHHVFNINKFDIRLISYVKNKNIKLKIRGDFEGEFKFNKVLKNGVFLYSSPVNLKNGNYKINIYDESGYSCNINLNFSIGNKYESKNEKVVKKYYYYYLAIRLSSILFFIYIFIIIFPFKSNYNLKIIDKIENIINGKNNNNTEKYNIFILIILLVILNQFILRKRFQNLNKIIKNTILFASIYPLILPIHFFEKIDGKIGYVINVFTIIDSSIKYEHWCLQMLYQFYISVIFPFIIYLSGFNYYNKSKTIKYFNILICSAIFIIFFYNHIYAIAQSISVLFLFLSSGSIICSIFILIIICKYNSDKKTKYFSEKITIVN